MQGDQKKLFENTGVNFSCIPRNTDFTYATPSSRYKNIIINIIIIIIIITIKQLFLAQVSLYLIFWSDLWSFKARFSEMVNVSSFEALQTGFAEMLSTAGINLLCVIINFIIHSLSGGYLFKNWYGITGSNVPKNPCGKELLWVQPKLNHCTDGCAQSLQAMVEKQDGSCAGSLRRWFVGKLPGIRYLETPTSSVCTREMNSDCPLCLQFHTSRILTACFFDS